MIHIRRCRVYSNKDLNRTDLEERRQNYGTSVAKFKSSEQLREDLVFTEVFWERVQIVAQVLEELLLLRWLLDLE